jgi:hypothetical protein
MFFKKDFCRFHDRDPIGVMARRLVLGLCIAVRICAASGPDVAIVVRREWTARLAPPAREWTERIGQVRFQEDKMIGGVMVSSARVVPLLNDEFAMASADEPQWSYLAQLAQAAFSFNNTCADAALLVSRMWPSQAHRMQAWAHSHPAASLHAILRPRDQGCRRAANDAPASMKVSAFPILSVMPPAPLIFDLERLVSSVECLRDVESPLCIYRHVCFVAGVVELARPIITSTLSLSVAESLWKLPNFDETRFVDVLGPEPTRLVAGRTLFWSGVVTNVAHANDHLSRLPYDLKLLGGRVSQVLLYTPDAPPRRALQSVLDLLSLAFEEEGFQLPTLHDFEALASATRHQRVCFEEWAFVSDARAGGQPTHRTSNLNATRTPEEADGVRRLAYKRCNIPAADGVVNALTSTPKLLFFERAENRLITSAPELCERLRPMYDTWLFKEPDDLGFCTQIRAIHWADIIVMKVGSHMEYAGIGARRGSALIVVYSYPLVVHKFESMRTSMMPGLRLLDLPTFDEAPVDVLQVKWGVADTVGIDPYQLSAVWAQCQLISFGTVMLPGRHQCERLLLHNNTFVDSLTLEPYLEAAVREIKSGNFDASNPCYSSGLLCEPDKAVQPCRADRQCNFAMQILNVKETLSHNNMSFVPSTWTWNVEEVRLRWHTKRSHRHHREDRTIRRKATSSNVELRHVMEKLASNNSDLGSVEAACAFFERGGQVRDSYRCRRYLEQVGTERRSW